MSWDEIVGKLMLRGFTPEQIGDMTLKQVHQAIYAMTEEMKWQVRLAGGEVDEEQNEVTPDNVGILEAMINASIPRM
jgi:hypothetical protein